MSLEQTVLADHKLLMAVDDLKLWLEVRNTVLIDLRCATQWSVTVIPHLEDALECI